MKDLFRNIPEHEHTHTLYVHCLSCKSFGVPQPSDFMEAVECGNCGSMDTVKYYPGCCIVADRRKSYGIKDIMGMTMFGIVIGFYVGIATIVVY